MKNSKMDYLECCSDSDLYLLLPLFKSLLILQAGRMEEEVEWEGEVGRENSRLRSEVLANSSVKESGNIWDREGGTLTSESIVMLDFFIKLISQREKTMRKWVEFTRSLSSSFYACTSMTNLHCSLPLVLTSPFRLLTDSICL